MTIGLSTRWMGVRPWPPRALLDALRETDLRACGLSRAASGPAPDALAESLRPAGVRVVAVEAGFVATGAVAERVGSLVSLDPEERALALAEARAAAAIGKQVGARHVVIRLGRLDRERAREREEELLASLRVAGPSDAVQAAAQAIAREVDRALDGLLDPLCRTLFDLCRREPEVRFAIATPDSLFSAPNARALDLLLDDLGQPNLGYWHDAAAARLHDQLGVTAAVDWPARHGARILGLYASDAAGGDLHLPPGAGEIDFRGLRDLLPSGVPCLVDVDARFPLREVRLAATYLRSVGF